MREKLAITVFVIMLALFALFFVLYNLVKVHNEEYSRKVLNQRSTYNSRTLPYRRGDIVDRNGTYLATSNKVYNLIIDARNYYKAPVEVQTATLDCLVQAFGLNRSELAAEIEKQPNSQYIRYADARRLSYDQKKAYEDLVAKKNNELKKAKVDGKIDDIWFEEEYRRIYPYNSLGCNVIGFCQGDGTTGTGGIEQYYNSVLNGNNGREYGYLNDDSNMQTIIKQPTNGHTIVSTIDVNIQNLVEKRIQEWQETTGSEQIGIIVMNPNNGEILAMATGHPYDLNDPWDVSRYYSQEDLESTLR